ncbi:MAG TPA: hypothetical protein VFW78_13575, partial [Bacteroidia bacterium]|nr:hypothetical protein [Bacteroidia bacterium]
MKRHLLIFTATVALLLFNVRQSSAQNFTSGPIPLCDTVTFTCNLSGIGILYPPGMGFPGSLFISSIGINITSDHPEGLAVTLTSPQGTTLLLTAYNGAGGSNYTNCVFPYGTGSPPITSGSAPFTGSWQTQGPGGLTVFDYENGDGIWIITVSDTMGCGGGGGGGGLTPGYFNGSGGTAGFQFNYSVPPWLCSGWIPFNAVSVCPGTPVDILGFYNAFTSTYQYTVYDNSWTPVANPSAVTVAGTYNIEAYDPWDGCYYYATFQVNYLTGTNIGPDVNVSICNGQSLNLFNYFSLGPSYQWYSSWNPISGLAAGQINTPGIYQVIANPGSGCPDTAVATVTALASPNLGPDVIASICTGNSYNLTTAFTTTGLTTAWTFNGSAVPNPASVTAPGIYQLIATNGAGCEDTALVTINTNSGVSLGPDQNVSGCIVGSYNLTPLYNTTGLSATWYLLGNPVANPSAVVTNGTYILVATGASGCADTAQVTLNVSQKPNLGPDQTQNICSGASLNLTTLYSTFPNTPQWYYGGTPFATPASATNGGVYTLIVTSLNGCADTAEVTLNVQPAPSLGPNQFHAICTNASIDLTGYFNTAGYTTSWTYNGVPIPDPTA